MAYGFNVFAVSSLASGITAGATSCSVQTGHGSRFPTISGGTTGFMAVIWNSTDYDDAASAYHAGEAEIVLVTARSGDDMTITRAQESTSAVAHNTAGKTYTFALVLTQGMIANIGVQSGAFLISGALTCQSQVTFQDQLDVSGDTTFSSEVLLGDGFTGIERTDPSAPAADRGILYFRDSGGGKTQLCVRFNTGAVQVIATEP